MRTTTANAFFPHPRRLPDLGSNEHEARARQWPWIVLAILMLAVTIAVVLWAMLVLGPTAPPPGPPALAPRIETQPPAPAAQRLPAMTLRAQPQPRVHVRPSGNPGGVLGAIQSEYERQLRAHPALAGDIVAKIAVGPDGRAEEVTIVRDTVGSPELTARIRGLLAGWRAPVAAGARAEYQMPFHFRATKAR